MILEKDTFYMKEAKAKERAQKARERAAKAEKEAAELRAKIEKAQRERAEKENADGSKGTKITREKSRESLSDVKSIPESPKSKRRPISKVPSIHQISEKAGEKSEIELQLESQMAELLEFDEEENEQELDWFDDLEMDITKELEDLEKKALLEAEMAKEAEKEAKEEAEELEEDTDNSDGTFKWSKVNLFIHLFTFN